MSKNSDWKHNQLKRKVKAQDKRNYDFKRDTEAALARPSEPTPLQLQRLEKSEKVKESKKKPSRLNREAKERARRDRINLEADLKRVSGLSSSEFNAQL